MGNRNSIFLFLSRRGSCLDATTEEDWELLTSPGGDQGFAMEVSAEKRSQPAAESLHNGGVRIRKGGEAEERQDRKSNKHAAGTVLSLFIVAILSITLGLLVGQNLYGATVYCSSDSSRGPLHDWGDTVLVDGKKQPVTGYLASKMSADDIKENLK